MVATSVLLDQDPAVWALLDVVIALGPTFQQPLLCFRIPMGHPLLATEPFVVLPAGCADSHKARSALENPIFGTGFERVDFGTVGGGAISEFIRMVAEVFEEGNFQQAFESGWKEESLYGGKGDRNTTSSLIGHA